MKTTVTAAIAIAGLAGMAIANIETPAAGYAAVTGSSSAQYVCNPFNSFTGAATTLGDIDGSNLSASTDYIKVINTAGSAVLTAKWRTVGGVTGWFDDGDVCQNGYALARGNAIQFYGASAGKLVVAGYLGEAKTFTLTAKAQNWIGNTSPLAKTVADIVPSSFNGRKDAAYFVDPSTGVLTPAVYYNAAAAAAANLAAPGWYKKSDTTAIGSWVLPSGQGFMMMPNAAGVTISISAL